MAPLRASTAKAERHRLNPRGDRQANSALYIVAMSRLRRAVVPNVMDCHHSISTQIPVRILEQQWSASVSPRGAVRDRSMVFGTPDFEAGRSGTGPSPVWLLA